MTLSEYLPHWLNTYSISVGLAQNTVNGYHNNITLYILPCIGSVTLEMLTPDDIDLLISFMHLKGLSVTSQRYVLATLRIALNTAVKRGYISKNPIECIDMPKPRKYVPVVLNKEQLQTLFNACFNNFDYLPFLVLLFLPLRRGEMLGLKWSDFDFDSNSVFIQRTATPSKGGYKFSPCKTQNSVRMLLFPEVLTVKLLAFKEVQKPDSDSDFVFSLSSGNLISANVLRRRFKKLLRELGLPSIRIHDLRHSWATLMLSEGVNPKVASSILGHSNVNITLDTYSHMLTGMQKPAVDVVKNVFVS